MDYDIRELIDLLNKYTKAYDEGHPEISDKEWDDLYFSLVRREQETGIIYPDSPTQKISYQVVNALSKVEHSHPMLSLNKTKEVSSVKSFIGGKPFVVMFKMDGLTCSLTYENGKLVKAETRGNGEIGEDILHNAKVVKNIPQFISYKDKLVVDGEIICRKDDFKPFANEYKNPRNFASGSIRLLDAKECASRNLTFVVWEMIEGYDEQNSLTSRLWTLENLGFTVVPFMVVPFMIEGRTVEERIKYLDELDAHNIYPIDGYVFKFDDVTYGKSLGATAHHANNAIAFKFYDETYETRLKYIEYTMGRTGVLTPVAVFEPIDIDGSTVERASLHNLSIMEEIMGDCCYAGQRLEIFKANQIIPQVKSAVKMNYGEVVAAGGISVDGFSRDFIPCPCCGEPTSIIISDSGVKNLVCDNPKCEGKLINRLDHFCGKKGLDIKGLSEKTLEKLIEWGWLNGLDDLFELDKHKTEWMAKPGFGSASVGKILDNINAAKSGTKLSAFIASIGIPLIGTTVAKEIIKIYPTWDEFKDAVGGKWSDLDGFGPEMEYAINKFDYTEADKIAGRLTFEQPDSQKEAAPAAAINGMTFVVTGKLKSFKNRDELKADIEANGGKVTGSVTSKTNYLINNDITSTTAKNKTAKDLGIPIITEEQYLAMKS